VAVVNSSGTATISIPIAADELTEGAEVLIITSQGKIASTTINDTSLTPPPTYVLSSATSSVNEGSTASFTLTTTNISSGTIVPYIFSGVNISTSDIVGGQLSGNAIVGSNGQATIFVSIAADGSVEGPETLVLSLQVNSANRSIVINDTGITKTGTSGAELLSGTVGSDTIDGGAGVDTFLLSGNRASYTISKNTNAFTFANVWAVSSVTEGVDILTNVERIKFADVSLALDVDTTAGQCYRIYKAAFARTPDWAGVGYWMSVMDSGTSLQAVAAGFVSSAEFRSVYGTNPTNAALVSSFYTNVLGRAPDATGAAYWTGILNQRIDTVAGVLSNISESAENKAAVALAIGSGFVYQPYEAISVAASSASVNEGSILSFMLTTNLPLGSIISYTLSGIGINSADIVGGSLSGTAMVGANGAASVSIGIVADNLIEGAETLAITAKGQTASIIINDTSGPPTYALSAAQSAINEGGTAIFTLFTTNVAAGTLGAYTLSGTGITSSDITGGQLSGTVVINSSGTATISVPVAADLLKEGSETLIVSVLGQTAATVINDTSLPLPTYLLSGNAPSVSEGEMALFNLITSNVDAGTLFNYDISGVNITSGDFTDGRMQGTVRIDNFGRGTISIPIKADGQTELPENMTVTLVGIPSASASMIIYDTKGGGGDGGGGGSGG
jgi:hypothetical protein